ncbi:DUF4012 domain-containing protein [Bifidobacterium dentium]|uniref:DUF4012 domain-containing protein n=1 Tax=Bifidobacterium dentium TaxID=1689 RepID=UPI00237AECFB|nr:DUF4012 domain-containing protein [Bifidobacterium dentium]
MVFAATTSESRSSGGLGGSLGNMTTNEGSFQMGDFYPNTEFEGRIQRSMRIPIRHFSRSPSIFEIRRWTRTSITWRRTSLLFGSDPATPPMWMA